MAISLTPAEARKIALLSQRLSRPERKGRAIDVTMSAISHLGYIQIDTISVVCRAHHHTLWSRNPRYQPKQLDRLLAERRIFEYWSHAAAYLPMHDYRFAMPRMELEKRSGGHWHNRNPKLMREVLDRIRDEGPLSARDFEDTGGKRAVWERKPAKYALEQLFMEGEIMTSARQGFQKVYDLTERVLPGNIDTRQPDQGEYARYLITTFLRAHGLGKPAEFGHLRAGIRPVVADTVAEMREEGSIESVSAVGEDWLMLPEAMDLLAQPLARSKVRILSPFDNLVILRKRLASLFGFDYQIECYLPANKRRYGYFSLPVLWRGGLAARMDCKAHRREGLLEVRHLALEKEPTRVDEFCGAMASALDDFAAFNDCIRIKIARVTIDGKTAAKLKGGINQRLPVG